MMQLFLFIDATAILPTMTETEQKPRAWLMLDHEKVTRYGKAMRGDAQIDGIRFFAVKQRAVSNG